MLKPELITHIPLNILLLDPGHPRQLIDPQSLARLSTDIFTHGILQPLIVRLKPYNPDLPCAPPPEYFIVNGGRRFRAAKLAGFTTVPCLIRDLSEREALEWQLAENAQREDLSPLDRLRAMNRLYASLYPRFGRSAWDLIAKRLELSPRRIHQLRSLSSLPPSVRTKMESGEISISHAVALTTLPNRRSVQEHLAALCVKQPDGSPGLTTRELRRRIKLSRISEHARELIQQHGRSVWWTIRFLNADEISPRIHTVLSEIDQLLDQLLPPEPGSPPPASGPTPSSPPPTPGSPPSAPAPPTAVAAAPAPRTHTPSAERGFNAHTLAAIPPAPSDGSNPPAHPPLRIANVSANLRQSSRSPNSLADGASGSPGTEAGDKSSSTTSAPDHGVHLQFRHPSPERLTISHNIERSF